jgi:hypothetical protein
MHICKPNLFASLELWSCTVGRSASYLHPRLAESLSHIYRVLLRSTYVRCIVWSCWDFVRYGVLIEIWSTHQAGMLDKGLPGPPSWAATHGTRPVIARARFSFMATIGLEYCAMSRSMRRICFLGDLFPRINVVFIPSTAVQRL